jgi:phage tail tape-measure protein
MSTKPVEPRGKHLNQDPITGAPGAHPVGVGVGAAAGGAATGAALGVAAGPAGAAIGAVAGAVIGGFAGKEVAEHIDPTVEDAYWKEHHTSRPYYNKGMTYEDYKPAYHYGLASRTKYQGRTFDEIEPQLGTEWSKAKAKSRLEWEKAKLAARDAWERIENRKREG